MSIMMSPGLEEIIALEDEAASDNPGAEISCVLSYAGGKIKGGLESFSDVKVGGIVVGLEVAFRLDDQSLPEALECNEFVSMDISINGRSLTSRVIKGGWIQRREVRPRSSGGSLFTLTVREQLGV